MNLCTRVSQANTSDCRILKQHDFTKYKTLSCGSLWSRQHFGNTTIPYLLLCSRVKWWGDFSERLLQYHTSTQAKCSHPVTPRKQKTQTNEQHKNWYRVLKFYGVTYNTLTKILYDTSHILRGGRLATDHGYQRTADTTTSDIRTAKRTRCARTASRNQHCSWAKLKFWATGSAEVVSKQRWTSVALSSFNLPWKVVINLEVRNLLFVVSWWNIAWCCFWCFAQGCFLLASRSYAPVAFAKVCEMRLSVWLFDLISNHLHVFLLPGLSRMDVRCTSNG